jgi:nicotinamidase/pyrazinamidase
MQNDFADPAGSLFVQGGPVIVRRVNLAIAEALVEGTQVIYTQDWHPHETPHFAKNGGIWPDHCIAGTWGAELHPELFVRGEIVRKGSSGEDGYSGFTMRDPVSGATRSTGLAELLAAEQVEEIVVAGLATDYCVKETALDGVRLGFAVAVRSDLVAAVNLQPGDGEAALTAMRDSGVRVVGAETA